MARRKSDSAFSLVSVLIVMATLATLPAGLAGQGRGDTHRLLHDLGDFRLESGGVLPRAQVAYATFGTLNAEKSNAVLLPSWYGSDHHGYDFLIGPGRALDPATHFIVATEMFANGFSSSPVNTLAPFDGPRFPAVTIRDNVEASRRVLSALGVTHLRAVIGFSMGAQQAFQWAVSHPGFADRIVAYCGTAKTYPHGIVRLEGAISALTADAAFRDGEYTSAPQKGFLAWTRHWAGWTYSQEWWRRELFKPRTVDEMMDSSLRYWSGKDANGLISQARTWQRNNVGDTPGFGGDHERALASIRVPVLYMPSQTDLYFPLADAQYESQFIKDVRFAPIPSIWGHLAGGGNSPADNEFLNAEILRFLK